MHLFLMYNYGGECRVFVDERVCPQSHEDTTNLKVLLAVVIANLKFY